MDLNEVFDEEFNSDEFEESEEINEEMDAEEETDAGTGESGTDVNPTAESTPTPTVEDKKAADDKKRKEFEESEAKRKAEWEAKQAVKKAADAKALAELDAMSDDDAAAASVKRLAADTERLTRRNMKILVTEYVQTLCFEDMAFARLAMHPRKNMVNCFRYINRLAKDFLEKEAKENDEKLSGGVGGDVPDDMVYKWAEAYFRDSDAEEDKDAEDKFVPKTYYGGGTAVKKKEPKPKSEPKKKSAPSDSGQFSMLEEVA